MGKRKGKGKKSPKQSKVIPRSEWKDFSNGLKEVLLLAGFRPEVAPKRRPDMAPLIPYVLELHTLCLLCSKDSLQHFRMEIKGEGNKEYLCTTPLPNHTDYPDKVWHKRQFTCPHCVEQLMLLSKEELVSKLIKLAWDSRLRT